MYTHTGHTHAQYAYTHTLWHTHPSHHTHKHTTLSLSLPLTHTKSQSHRHTHTHTHSRTRQKPIIRFHNDGTAINSNSVGEKLLAKHSHPVSEICQLVFAKNCSIKIRIKDAFFFNFGPSSRLQAIAKCWTTFCTRCYLRPHSHRTRKPICMQTLWCCLQPVWTLPFAAVSSIICMHVVQGAPRPVWTGPNAEKWPLVFQQKSSKVVKPKVKTGQEGSWASDPQRLKQGLDAEYCLLFLGYYWGLVVFFALRDSHSAQKCLSILGSSSSAQ